MFKKLRNFLLLVGSFILTSIVVVYYLQKPALTPIYSVYAPIEPPMYAAKDSEKDSTLVPFLDPTSNLYGYQAPAGQLVIKPQFSRALEFSKYGIADVYMESSMEWLKIDKTGKILITSYFYDNGPDYYVNGLSRFVKDNKIGFIDREGHQVIAAAYDWAGIFTYNFPITVVAKGCNKVRSSESEYEEVTDGKWGIIDKHGKVIIPIIYDGFTFGEQTEEGKSGILTFIQGDQKYQLFHTRWGRYVLIRVV